MKEDFNDIEFKKFFQEKAHQPGENRWFTPRVLNRLPEKAENGNALAIEKWAYAIGLLLCIAGWTFLYISGFFDVITIRSMIHIFALSIGSFFLMIQTIRTTFSL